MRVPGRKTHDIFTLQLNLYYQENKQYMNMDILQKQDKEVADAIASEIRRQTETLELIEDEPR